MVDKFSGDETEGADSAPASALPEVIYLPDGRQRTKKVTSGSQKRRRRHMERFATDDAEHEALHKKVAASGSRLGGYVMRLAQIETGPLSRPRQRGKASVNTVALTQAVVALNRAGNNQNQIARALNELTLVAHERNNTRLESELRGLAGAVKEIPTLFAAPVAAILAALRHDREG